MENVKIFEVRGEYRMSEEDNFKTARKFALESAEKNLDAEVKSFLREKFPNLDENDISDISEKFLRKNEPNFIRENLPNDEMIYYAEIKAEINLTALDNFMENFEVFELKKKVSKLEKKNLELEKKVSELEKIVKELKNNLKTSKDNSRNDVSESKNYPQYKEKYEQAMKYYYSGDFSQAINLFCEVIQLNPRNKEACRYCGYAYRKIGRHDRANYFLSIAGEI